MRFLLLLITAAVLINLVMLSLQGRCGRDVIAAEQVHPGGPAPAGRTRRKPGRRQAGRPGIIVQKRRKILSKPAFCDASGVKYNVQFSKNDAWRRRQAIRLHSSSMQNYIMPSPATAQSVEMTYVWGCL